MQSNFDVEVEILRTDFTPSGVGEMGIPSAAPALTNAIYAASRVRIRDLPMRDQLQRSIATRTSSTDRA